MAAQFPLAFLSPRTGRGLVRLLGALLGLWLGWGTMNVAQGKSGDIYSLPLPRSKVKHALRLEMDCRGVDANGYRPFVIKGINWPIGPTTADRSIRLVITTNQYGGFSNYSHQVTGYLEMPAGATQATTTLLVPQLDTIQMFDLEVFEDGERLKELCYSTSMSRSTWDYAYYYPTILMIDKDVPLPNDRELQIRNYKMSSKKQSPTYELGDFRSLVDVLPQNNYYNSSNRGVVARDYESALSDVQLLDMADTRTAFNLAGLGELPDNWLALSCYGLTVIPLDDLLTLANKHPERFQALRQWLGTGTTLCVSGVGEDFSRLAELEKCLKLSDLPPDEKYPERRGWSVPQDSSALSQIALPGNQYNYAPAPVDTLGDRLSKKTPKFIDDPPFLFRDVDLGIVFAIPHELSGEKPPRTEWNALLNTAGASRWLWSGRHGIGTGNNPAYWEFLIPGVGMAPVLSFVVLISLFMALIGPVNYWLMRRFQRTYLLLITVPAGAAIVTLGLFLYALATEGLRVNARIRSFTVLDSKQNRATSISRHSYYASLTPSGGLVFPAHAAVYPLDPYGSDYSDQHNRALIWEDEEHQRLRSGYLFPRTVAQFVVVEPSSSQARLQVKGPPDDAKGRSVVNELGCRIEQVFVTYSGGVLYAENIEPGATAPLGASKQDWKLKFNESEPKQLVDFNPSKSQNLFSFVFEGPGYWGSSYTVETSTSLLESNLASVSMLPNIQKLPPGRFVALVERPAEVSVGITSAREVASFHVILGEW